VSVNSQPWFSCGCISFGAGDPNTAGALYHDKHAFGISPEKIGQLMTICFQVIQVNAYICVVTVLQV
jgi:hypothetical protein